MLNVKVARTMTPTLTLLDEALLSLVELEPLPLLVAEGLVVLGPLVLVVPVVFCPGKLLSSSSKILS